MNARGVGAGAPAHRTAFGRRVAEVRKERGLSQERLAHDAGIDRSYLGGVERGQRNVALDNIVKIARALGVQPGVLMPVLPTGDLRGHE